MNDFAEAPSVTVNGNASRMPVLAAGAVVWKEGNQGGGVDICLVHRPRYDDWSLPKGKPFAGEHILACAAREVAEETAQRVVLGRPLPVQRYAIRGGTKVVRYWLAHADDEAGSRMPDDEIDEVIFLPVSAALDRLSYRRDAQLVLQAVQEPMRTTPLVLLRHASARPRSTWGNHDVERPLDAKGLADASTLVDALSSLGIQRVVSSHAVRCVETIRPFVQRHGLTLEVEPLLSEESLQTGQRPHPVMAIVQALLHGGPALVCSHRPVLPLLFESAGVTAAPTLHPAGFVVIHHHSGHVVATDRHDVPASAVAGE